VTYKVLVAGFGLFVQLNRIRIRVKGVVRSRLERRIWLSGASGAAGMEGCSPTTLYGETTVASMSLYQLTRWYCARRGDVETISLYLGMGRSTTGP